MISETGGVKREMGKIGVGDGAVAEGRGCGVEEAGDSEGWGEEVSRGARVGVRVGIRGSGVREDETGRGDGKRRAGVRSHALPWSSAISASAPPASIRAHPRA